MPETKLTPPPSAAAPNGGRTLPQPLLHQMETTFGQSLSHVRVHEDHRPTLLGASAFTSGSEIVFAPGQYAPGTQQGQSLIAHELAHVVQQRSGPVNTVEVDDQPPPSGSR